MSSSPILVWFRQDLRLSDNPALTEAAKHGAIIPVYILDDEAAGLWQLGGASRWWLHHSLTALQRSLEQQGLSLILRRGDSATILADLIAKTGAQAVYWNRRYEPYAVAQDKRINTQLAEQTIEAKSFQASLLYEPWDIQNKQGNPFKVFTPFWKHCMAGATPRAPLPVPSLSLPDTIPTSDALGAWNLLPTAPDWSGGLKDRWNPGEAGAQQQLTAFLGHGFATYADQRDFPAKHTTSHLSAHLHFGEISPHQFFHAAQHAAIEQPPHHLTRLIAEIGWREFSYHLLYHFPTLPDSPFRSDFSHFPWLNNPEALARWQQGQTGYPIVDAGMRELWHTGFMHNRVRMIVASFLTKHLLIPWQEGAQWFWDCLVDADLASNSASWQWVAGCGADAAPYFRIFNPTLQSQKFDTNRDYIRRWVPELAALSAKQLHEPWKHSATKHYPAPIIDHTIARQRALDAYQAIRQTEPPDAS